MVSYHKGWPGGLFGWGGHLRMELPRGVLRTEGFPRTPHRESVYICIQLLGCGL